MFCVDWSFCWVDRVWVDVWQIFVGGSVFCVSCVFFSGSLKGGLCVEERGVAIDFFLR